MKSLRRIAPLAALCLIVLVASLASCSKSTSPATGGGGGGGGTKELNSGDIANGGTYMHTFASAGTFGYHCTIHGTGMAGTVTVASGQPANAAVTIGNNFYNPASVSVAPGGTVNWTNNGVTHTVTSN